MAFKHALSHISVGVVIIFSIVVRPGLEAVGPPVRRGGIYHLVEPAARRVINEVQVIDRFRLETIHAGYYAHAFDGGDIARRVVAKAGRCILVGRYGQDALARASVQVPIRGAGYPVERVVAGR